MKWLPLALLGLFLAAFIWWQSGNTKVAYVNGLEPYNQMPGREFILQHDAYVFQWKNGGTGGFPLLGVNTKASAGGIPELPASFDRANIGHNHDKVNILDAIPQGTHFIILSVRRETKKGGKEFITYEAKFTDDKDSTRAYQKVDIRPLLLPATDDQALPTINPALAAEWKRL